MKNNISNAEHIKNSILPKIENKIRFEIMSLIDEDIKKSQNFNSDERNRLYDEYINKLLELLGCNSLIDFIEFEYHNIIKTFNKYFPYTSIEHFIESHLKQSFGNLSMSNQGITKDRNEFDNNEDIRNLE